MQREGEPRVVLHVGAMKSGTSFLQATLFAHKAALRRQGVFVPGRDWYSQVWAVKQVLQHDGGHMWDKHTAAVSAHPGTSVVSMEFLGPVLPEKARRIVASFDVPVEVVVTARDLNRSIAAMWQETVQNGRTWTWPHYLESVERDRPGHRDPDAEVPESGRAFWRQQNLVRIVRTWAGVVGADRVTLVTVPPPGAPADVLWRRFAGLVGVDPEELPPPRQRNQSLGAASALLLRRVNELLAEQGIEEQQGAALRKGLLAKQVLAAHKGQEAPIGLPVAPWVVEHSAEMVRDLQASGVRLVGDWADLDPVDVPGVDVGTVSDAEVGDAAVVGLAGLLGEWIREDEARRAAERDR